MVNMFRVYHIFHGFVNALASIIEKDKDLIQSAIDKRFKPSKKCYKNLTDDKTIEKISKIINQ